MADHLRLPGPDDPAARNRRANGYDPDGPPPTDRPQHASTLRGQLEGLGFPFEPTSAEEPPVEMESEDSRIVLVFTGTAPLTTGIFRGCEMTPLSETESKGMAVLSASESRATFARLVERYGGDPADWDKPDAWRDQLDVIDDVRLYSREDRLAPDLAVIHPVTQPVVVDVSLWPTSLDGNAAKRIADDRIHEIRVLVDQATDRDPACRLLATDPRPETLMVRVRTDQLLIDDLLEHPLVERVALPLKAPVTVTHFTGVANPADQPEPDGAPVGVIDDLVMDHPYLDGVIQAQAQFPAGHAWGPPTDHGTQVASIAAYRDLRPLLTDGETRIVPHPVYSARILHQDSTPGSGAVVAGLFHTQLEDGIRWLASQGVKIINLSVTYDTPQDRAHASEASAIIDTLAKELDLVIVVASGNRVSLPQGHWKDDYPTYLKDADARIAEPGTAALAVTTGAVSLFDTPGALRPDTQIAIARSGKAAPFTRTGPSRGTTPAGTRKPEFAAHGGNWAWDDQLEQVIQHDPNLGVPVLVSPANHNGRLVATTSGTSFAAPYVAHQAATIATRYPAASANRLIAECGVGRV